jgi:hypothetical protein
MRVFAWNWHSPYWAIWKQALPEVDLYLAPTSHAPTGWRDDQRSMPAGISITAAPDAGDDLLILQTAQDIDNGALAGYRGRILFLSHNRADHEAPGIAHGLNMQRLPLVSISPMKAASWKAAGYQGDIRTITPYAPASEYETWQGNEPRVLTVANNLRRDLFDAETWTEATKGLDVTLVGEGNEDLPGAIGPARDWEHLKSLYRSHRVYLSVNRWPHEDGYNLSLLEAMAAGMPVVGLQNPTTPLSVEERENAMWLRHELDSWLGGRRSPGDRHYNVLRGVFPKERFATAWRKVLEEVVNG